MDVYGKALKEFYSGKRNAKIRVESNIAETEYWPVKEFFHEWKDMSLIEQTALKLCKGRVLDVGAGSGSHVLWLQREGLQVHAIDISEGAVDVMRERGINCVEQVDFFELQDRQYDTLLMLMNGAGIAGTMERLPEFLGKAKSLLAKGGQLLMDSSDLIYLYEDEEGGALIDLNGDYYGELEYVMSYNGQKGEAFDWLFIDFDTLQSVAEGLGMECEKVYEDDHYQYLARLIVR